MEAWGHRYGGQAPRGSVAPFEQGIYMPTPFEKGLHTCHAPLEKDCIHAAPLLNTAHMPHGGLRTFHQKFTSLYAMSLRALFGSKVGHVPPQTVFPETLVVHPVACEARFRGGWGTPTPIMETGYPQPFQHELIVIE